MVLQILHGVPHLYFGSLMNDNEIRCGALVDPIKKKYFMLKRMLGRILIIKELEFQKNDFEEYGLL